MTSIKKLLTICVAILPVHAAQSQISFQVHSIPQNRSHTVCIHPNATVLELKHILVDKSNLWLYEQALSYSDNKLTNDKELQHYGIGDGVTINLDIEQDSKTQEVHFLIGLPAGDMVSNYVASPKVCTLGALKGHVQNEASIPIENQSIFYQKDDDKSLHELKRTADLHTMLQYEEIIDFVSIQVQQKALSVPSIEVDQEGAEAPFSSQGSSAWGYFPILTGVGISLMTVVGFVVYKRGRPTKSRGKVK